MSFIHFFFYLSLFVLVIKWWLVFMLRWIWYLFMKEKREIFYAQFVWNCWKNCVFVKWVGLNFLWYAKSLGGGEYLVEKVWVITDCNHCILLFFGITDCIWKWEWWREKDRDAEVLGCLWLFLCFSESFKFGMMDLSYDLMGSVLIFQYEFTLSAIVMSASKIWVS